MKDFVPPAEIGTAQLVNSMFTMVYVLVGRIYNHSGADDDWIESIHATEEVANLARASKYIEHFNAITKTLECNPAAQICNDVSWNVKTYELQS